MHTESGYSPSAADLAYIAGFFDGEGWLGIIRRQSGKNKKTGKKYTQYLLMLGAGQNDPRPIGFIQARFPGSIRAAKQGNHMFYTWQLASQKAEDFLIAVAPYLINKREQCELAMHYRAFLKSRRKGFQGILNITPNEQFRELMLKVRAQAKEKC